MLGTDRPSVSLAAKILQRKKIIGYRRGLWKFSTARDSKLPLCYKVIRQFKGVLRLP